MNYKDIIIYKYAIYEKMFCILLLLSLASCMTPEQEAHHLALIRQAQINQDHKEHLLYLQKQALTLTCVRI